MTDAKIQIGLWVGLGLLCYFIFFSTTGAWIPAVAVFLIGFGYGGYCQSLRARAGTESSNVSAWADGYFPVCLPIFFITWSALVTIPSFWNAILLAALGMTLIFLAMLFGGWILRNNESRRLLLYILFGPIVCGFLTGLGAIALAIWSLTGGKEIFWTIALLFLGTSLIPVILAIIWRLLWGMERPRELPEPPREAAG